MAEPGRGAAPPLRVLSIFGTRPEAIKLFPVVAALRAQDGIESRTCVTAQHRAMLDQVLACAGLVPDHDLDLMRDAQGLDALTARLVEGIGAVLDAERPHRVVVQGDTATAMAGALAAYYRRIPVAHVEAGLRSHDIYNPWPEEVNRKIVGAIADLHFAPTETAAAALRAETVPADRIFVTGNTVVDALIATRARIERDPTIVAAIDAVLARHGDRRIVAMTTHRRENFGDGLENIATAIERLAMRDDIAIVFPVHLNPAVRSVMHARLRGRDTVSLIEPLDYPAFVRLLSRCCLVLSDSGGVQEEAPTFGKPVLVMRETTERPEGIAAGTALLVGSDSDRIVAETERLLDQPETYQAMARAHSPFGDGQAAGRISAKIYEAGNLSR